MYVADETSNFAALDETQMTKRAAKLWQFFLHKMGM
jgi:hypothetical protein